MTIKLCIQGLNLFKCERERERERERIQQKLYALPLSPKEWVDLNLTILDEMQAAD